MKVNFKNENLIIEGSNKELERLKSLIEDVLNTVKPKSKTALMYDHKYKLTRVRISKES